MIQTQKRIRLVDLGAQWREIGAEVEAATQRVIQSAVFIGGSEVGAFEEEFAAFCGTSHCVGVASGTDALTLVLRAMGIGPGDEVITTTNTFIATAEAISNNGATPVFCEIDAATYQIDPADLARRISPRTRAIVAVHIYGQPAPMGPILELAQQHRLRVIEDCAQAHGATWRGRPVGSIGDAGCFSFFPGKNLGAFGDAGAVVSSDARLANAVRLMANHGRREKYVHEVVGVNSRLDALQAAVLRAKLRHLPRWNAARRRVAAQYRRWLAGSELLLPTDPPEGEGVYHLFVVRSADRDGVLQRMRSAGIEGGIHYPIPLHLQPAYAHLGYRQGDLPVAEGCAQEFLSLPMYPELQADQIRGVVDVLLG